MLKGFAAIFAGLLLGAGIITAINVAQAGDPGLPHYPDLRTRPPYDLRIRTEASRKVLRFSNTVWNAGTGRLELRPSNSGGVTNAYQRIYTHDAAGSWSLFSETLIGTFVFHPAHNHWHFNDFARYEIRNVNQDGSIGGMVHRTGTKMTFCLYETTFIDPSVEHASSTKSYTTCGQNDTTGLGPGWGDTYGWRLAGQEIDITDLPDGDYWLVSKADPDNRINEGGIDGNNTGATKFRLARNRVTILQ